VHPLKETSDKFDKFALKDGQYINKANTKIIIAITFL